jgi:hypothetical protein
MRRRKKKEGERRRGESVDKWLVARKGKRVP